MRICAILLKPFIPATAEEINRRLGSPAADWDSLNRYGILPAEVATARALCCSPDRYGEGTDCAGGAVRSSGRAGGRSSAEPLPQIDFETFEKVEMTVVKVVACEAVKKSKKLLKFTLNDGTKQPRQILSGIAQFYKPEELVGKTLVAVTNLAPRKMMGQESCGMLLSAERGDKLNLVMLDDAIPAGSRLV